MKLRYPTDSIAVYIDGSPAIDKLDIEFIEKKLAEMFTERDFIPQIGQKVQVSGIFPREMYNDEGIMFKVSSIHQDFNISEGENEIITYIDLEYETGWNKLKEKEELPI